MGDPESRPPERDPESHSRDRDAESLTTTELRERVEAEYDFENFGPAEMEQMSAEEWEAVFDPDTWITGQQLLDRVEADLRQRIADREVFARLERSPDHLVVYAENSHAIVFPDGSVEGTGTVLRDVKPTVALCSMDTYEVPDPPPDASLPRPEDVGDEGGAIGDYVLQAVAGVQLLAGVVLLGGALFIGDARWIAAAAGLGFLFIGALLGFVLVNARLSGRYRAAEYRGRLEAIEQRDPPEPLTDEDRADDERGLEPPA